LTINLREKIICIGCLKSKTPTQQGASILGVRHNKCKPMIEAKSRTDSKRKVLLHPGEDGYFVAEVPSLPGCITQGKTRDEALANVEEAIALYIKILQDRGELIPDDQVEVVLI
jgi:predicted RNase H-like HicB family nuclease